MAKRRRRPKNKQRPKQTSLRAQNSGGAGHDMAQRLLEGGPEYLHDNFIRLMQDSARLYHEPEFSDLYFDFEQTLAVAAKHFSRFSKRLEKAANRTERDTFATTYDDYRIAVIDELTSPKFKQQLKQGLERCSKRLGRNRDVELFESATFISVLLDSEKLTEELPLGVYGLVTMIYEASFDQAMGEVPNAYEVVGEDLTTIWQSYYQTEDLSTLEQAVATANSFDELLNMVDDEPNLGLALQRQKDHLMTELQEKTIGQRQWFTDHFFTADEIKLSLDRLEAKCLSKPWSMSRYISLLLMYNYYKCLKEVLRELIVPERRTELIEWWQEKGHLCFTSDEEPWSKLVIQSVLIINTLQSTPKLAHTSPIPMMYLAEMLFFASKKENLSPIMAQTFKRMEKGFLLKLIAKRL